MRGNGLYRGVLVAGIFLGASRGPVARADVASPNLIGSESSAPERVEIALVGALERDPPLFERIRSLFPNTTAVVLRPAHELDAGAVLQPARVDTLYLWVRLSSGVRARVYLATREESERGARYLFRDVDLDSGLDEVGSETLAQVAHSAAEALWRREEHTPKPELVEALEVERPAPSTRPKQVPLVARRTASGEPASDSAPLVRPVAVIARPGERSPVRDLGAVPKAEQRSATLGLNFGTSFTMHASGAEGWLAEPGLFVGAELRERFSLRLAGLYLVPTEFDVLPARVRVRGASGELRAGFIPWRSLRARVRLEAGLSLLFARWSANIAEPDPPAQAGSSQNFLRPSALAASTFEWPLGPIWIAARAELRVPLRKTRYEIERSEIAVSSGALNPGGGVELGLALDRIQP